MSDPERSGGRTSRLRSAGTIAGLVVLVAIVIFPLYYAVAGSLMSREDLTRFPPALFPTGLHVSSFGNVLNAVPLARQYGNSILVSLVVVLGVLVTSVLSGYVFAFLHFPFKRLAFGMFLATMMVPAESMIIPNYLTMADWGLVNTFPALFLPFLAAGFGTFLMRQFFLSFPKEVYEAAKVEGCGHLRFLWKILVPLSRPAIGTLAIHSFISSYNHYFWPLLVTSTPKMQTLQIGLAQLNAVEERAPDVIFAGVVLAIIPMLVMIYMFQRHIVRGLTAGAVR
ncbi:carbohydrate ABC transporter permease [Dactylosporangium roseum]|uniref:Carbohydrate ABC transporter permease n=1 Tax=Dactylosporangium roseum TaxID=47989 RepID=A0ABY5YWR1_9ACTN|nr:carbohydrate ABC transporter permease [Dactylosporangium roseum]UWZ34193.1 carbohydrate ABC transporter permease [Dactylosporangium roseum]